HIPVLLLFAGGSSVLFSTLSTRINWPHARFPAISLLPGMILVALAEAAEKSHPLAGLGVAARPPPFAAHLWRLARHDEEHSYFHFVHVGGLLLLCALCSWELSWHINHALQASPVWGHIAWAIVPACVLAALSAQAPRLPWPVRDHTATYLAAAGAPL